MKRTKSFNLEMLRLLWKRGSSICVSVPGFFRLGTLWMKLWMLEWLVREWKPAWRGQETLSESRNKLIGPSSIGGDGTRTWYKDKI